tara:strand:- start:988 stop:1122 length:135 start_codon:yes stop_codon:yes gene_type:complete
LSDAIRLVVLGMIQYLDKNQADEAGRIVSAFEKVKKIGKVHNGT